MFTEPMCDPHARDCVSNSRCTYVTEKSRHHCLCDDGFVKDKNEYGGITCCKKYILLTSKWSQIISVDIQLNVLIVLI
jgi:hypothetical protein